MEKDISGLDLSDIDLGRGDAPHCVDSDVESDKKDISGTYLLAERYHGKKAMLPEFGDIFLLFNTFLWQEEFDQESVDYVREMMTTMARKWNKRYTSAISDRILEKIRVHALNVHFECATVQSGENEAVITVTYMLNWETPPDGIFSWFMSWYEDAPLFGVRYRWAYKSVRDAMDAVVSSGGIEITSFGALPYLVYGEMPGPEESSLLVLVGEYGAVSSFSRIWGCFKCGLNAYIFLRANIDCFTDMAVYVGKCAPGALLVPSTGPREGKGSATHTDEGKLQMDTIPETEEQGTGPDVTRGMTLDKVTYLSTGLEPGSQKITYLLNELKEIPLGAVQEETRLMELVSVEILDIYLGVRSLWYRA